MHTKWGYRVCMHKCRDSQDTQDQRQNSSEHQGKYILYMLLTRVINWMTTASRLGIGTAAWRPSSSNQSYICSTGKHERLGPRICQKDVGEKTIGDCKGSRVSGAKDGTYAVAADKQERVITVHQQWA